MYKTHFYSLGWLGFLATSLISLSFPSFAAVLPSEREMRSKLVSVLNESRVEAELYPQLLSHAGAKVSPRQVAELFARATEQFLKGMSSNESSMVRVQIISYVKPFILALLEDYPDEAFEAIQIFNSEQPQEL